MAKPAGGEPKWFEFGQNNSGGSFQHDPEAGIGVRVFIEAVNSDQASARAQDIGLYFGGVGEGIDCGCCGDRWSEPCGEEGDSKPMLYGEEWRPVLEGEDPKLEWGLPSYIHPLDGPFVIATEA